jgi:hypothetical protein
MNNDNATQAAPPPEANPFAERAAEQAAAAEEKKSRSVFSSVTRSRKRRPEFGVLFGPPGIGKSTLLTKAPNPIYIPCERGLDHITVSKFPRPENIVEFYKMLLAVQNEEHPYETLVIDTMDGLELLVWDRVCFEGKVKSIEDYAGGYGKGFTRAREIFTGILNQLTAISEKTAVWLICHSHMKSVNDPILGTPYDTYELKLQTKSVEIVRQMVDLILFGKMEVVINKESPRAKKGRGVVTEDRILYCTPTTGVEAKNRMNFPDTLDFSYAAIAKAMDEFWSK